MVAVTAEEITPGLVTYLSIETLGSWPGVLTNVRRAEGEDRAANNTRPFIVLEVKPSGELLCAPLLSHAGDGRIALQQNLKQGPGAGWIKRVSYFSRYQFWIIPADAVVAASAGEMNPVGNRKRYADGIPAALGSIIAHQNDSDTEYGPISN